jgi:outer membrane protein assembly factor BamB
VFVGTSFGEVQCRSAKTGELLWSADVGEPIAFQPAVAGGRVYVSTSTGRLYCLETGDAGDDGWLMWGANAAHDGAARK